MVSTSAYYTLTPTGNVDYLRRFWGRGSASVSRIWYKRRSMFTEHRWLWSAFSKCDSL